MLLLLLLFFSSNETCEAKVEDERHARSLLEGREQEERGISNEMHKRLAAIDLLVRSFTWWRKAPAIDHTTTYLRPAEDVGEHNHEDLGAFPHDGEGIE